MTSIDREFMQTTPMKSVHRHNARCVIWRAPDQEVPPHLRKALQDRGLWFTECDTASWATAEACRLETNDDSTPVILLLLSPKSLPDAASVLRSCQRFAPQVSHWAYDEHADPKLHAIQYTDQDTAQYIPTLTVVNHDDSSDNPEIGCQCGQDSGSILTPDELDALKHPDPAGNDPS